MSELTERSKLDNFSLILAALSRFPFYGAIVSLGSALYDLYDIIISLFKRRIVARKTVISAAFFRFIGNALMGLGGLAPYITIAAFMIIHPCIIPIIAIIPPLANCHKYNKIIITAKKEIAKYNELFMQTSTQEILDHLREYREVLYLAKQERLIHAGLVVAALLSAIGLIFPPLLLGGLAVSCAIIIIGMVDKKYRFSERMSYCFFGNPEKKEERMVEKYAQSMNTLNPSLRSSTHFFGKTLGPILVSQKKADPQTNASPTQNIVPFLHHTHTKSLRVNGCG